MDLLKTTRTHWRRLATIVVALGYLVVAACLSLGGGGRSEPSFPHRVHVVDHRLDCTFCHAGARANDEPGMPPPELCAACHDIIDKQKPPERRIAAFYDGGRYRTLADATLPADVRFSHRAHVTGAKIDCTGCHGDIDRQEEVPVAPLVRKSECMDCHASYGKSNACSECHQEIDQLWRPRTHDKAWDHVHGDIVRKRDGASENRCTLCHLESTSCQNCHMHQAPRDHTNQFRLRTHGLLASMDRTRCMVCHKSDSCAQCHKETRPQSHRGGFGSPTQRHCTGCHLPLANTGCRACHDGTPSHATAAPLPPDHNPAMNCRMCHGNGVRLPHPDGGHACTACHR